MEIKSNVIKVVDSAEAYAKFYANGLLSLVIREGAYIDVAYILETKKIMDSLSAVKKFYVISESEGFLRVSQEARQLSASLASRDKIAAVAIVTNLSTRVIFDLYTKINKPLVATKAFTKRESGLQWLKDLMGDQWYSPGVPA